MEWQLDGAFGDHAIGGLGFKLYDGANQLLHDHTTSIETGPGSVQVNGNVKSGVPCFTPKYHNKIGLEMEHWSFLVRY